MTVSHCLNGYLENRVTIAGVPSAESDVGKLRAVVKAPPSANSCLEMVGGKEPPLQCDSPDTRSCSLSPAGFGRNLFGVHLACPGYRPELGRT